MQIRKAIAPLSIAVVLAAAVGPAAAKSKQQRSGDVHSAQTQGKAKGKSRSDKDCNRVTPPFMYNPHFMNRGFLKWGKCPK
jgi:hypothetical protein